MPGWAGAGNDESFRARPVSVPLPTGHPMRPLGFGTWQVTGGQATTATAAALAAGYRRFDTATVYGNDQEVGRTLADVRASVFPDDQAAA